jgi:hypothetical protein
MAIVHVSVVQFCSPASIPAPKTSARAQEHELTYNTELGVLRVKHKASGELFWVPAANVASFKEVAEEVAAELHSPPKPVAPPAPPPKPVNDTIVVKKVDGKVQVIEPKVKP